MSYKISNIAERMQIEQELGISCKYPDLYKPRPVINGSEEMIIPVVTLENPEVISYAIWGLLPKSYQDDWTDFQHILNTLTVSKTTLNTEGIFQEPFKKRRCLIIVTGFFTSFLYKGVVYPHYVYLSSQKPFCIAGVYNTLEDGFITCSIITTQANGIVREIENLNLRMPVPLPRRFYDTWLDAAADMGEIDHIVDRDNELALKAHPIATTFYKNDTSCASILHPVLYENLPNLCETA